MKANPKVRKTADIALCTAVVYWLAYSLASGYSMISAELLVRHDAWWYGYIAAGVVIRICGVLAVINEKNKKLKTAGIAVLLISYVWGGLWDLAALAVAWYGKPYKRLALVALNTLIPVLCFIMLFSKLGYIGILGRSLDIFSFGMLDPADFSHVLLLILALFIIEREARIELYEYPIMIVIMTGSWYLFEDILGLIFSGILLAACFLYNITGRKSFKIKTTWIIYLTAFVLAITAWIPHMGLHGSHRAVDGWISPCIESRAHVGEQGWESWSTDTVAGVTGQALRLEALEMKLLDRDHKGGISYQAHVQKIGWLEEVSDGETAGTTGQYLSIEALRIRLTGDMAKHYDVYYRAHVENIGWMGWAENGEGAGTTGHGLRMEAIQITLVRKGDPPPSKVFEGVSQNDARAFIENK